MSRYIWVEIQHILRWLHLYAWFFYFVGYSGVNKLDVGIVIYCSYSNLGFVLYILLGLWWFVCPESFSLLALLKKLLIKKSTVNSKVSVLLAVEAHVVAESLLPFWVLFSKYQRKIFRHSGNLFVDKFDFY